jgi:multicomponent Na+:H+ antiporter subunit D
MTPLAPLITSWLLAAVLLLMDGRRAWVCALAAAGLGAVCSADVILLVRMTLEAGPGFETVTGGWPQGVGIRLRVDQMSLFFGAIVSAVLTAVMIHEAREELRSRLFPSLLCFLATGLHGAFFTGDLFNFYVFFEVSVVTSFALAAYGYGRAEVRGAFVYVAVNLLGSVVFLVGVAIIYHATGYLDLRQIAPESGGLEREAMILGATLIFVALSLKLGMFPFHGWVPVLYSHAQPAVAAAMSGALVNIGAYGLLRFGETALASERAMSAGVLVAVGAVAGLYGALLAMRRRHPAEILAYISVAHAGYIVLALGVGGVHGAAALLLIALSGSLDKTLLFLSLDASRRWVPAVTLVGAASAAGLPVTIGFIAKIQLLRAALEAPWKWAALAALVIIGVLLLVAAFRFRQRLVEREDRKTPVSGMGVALAVLIIILGIAAAPVVNLATAIAATVTGEMP